MAEFEKEDLRPIGRYGPYGIATGPGSSPVLSGDCDAKRAPQIETAMGNLEKQSQHLADLARQVSNRLGPVMCQTPVANETTGGSKAVDHLAPLAKGLHQIEGQMRDTSYILENILQSLEL